MFRWMLTQIYLVKTFGGDQMEMESLKGSYPSSGKILKLKAIENMSLIIKRVFMPPFRNLFIVQETHTRFQYCHLRVTHAHVEARKT